MPKGQKTGQAKEYGAGWNTDPKTVNIASMLDKCCAEGLLDRKTLLGKNDCQYCPAKIQCDKVFEDSIIYSYNEVVTKLEEVFVKKHKWVKILDKIEIISGKDR